LPTCVSRVLRKGKNDFKKRIKDYEVVVVNPNPKGRPDTMWMQVAY